MGIFDIFKTKAAPVQEKRAGEPTANGYYGPTYSKSYDGEKNLGEIGPIIDYRLDYKALSLRSWQSYLESDIVKTVLDSYIKWIVDAGLKCKAEPAKSVLASTIGSFDDKEAETFNKRIESRWAVWAKSNQSVFGERMTFNTLSQELYKGAKIGGDMLVILRFVKGTVKVQMIDGFHVSTPYAFTSDKNVISEGVEMDKDGRHINYHVKTSATAWDIIPAYSKKTKFRTAFLVKGTKYRANDERGAPAIMTSLETVKKIERYKEATVGSAEERQKVVWQVVHQSFSDGENPIADKIAFAMDENNSQNDMLPQSQAGDALASDVYATTNKQTFNNPIGAELKTLDSDSELSFKEFYQTNADIVCASMGIPPNVAFSIYNDSFSASRAATKDWEHTILVERENFRSEFLQHVYNFWLYSQVITLKVEAPGYLDAVKSGDWMTQEAYQCVRFTGPLFPHIDPLKEVKAEREKLGVLGAHLPLTTLEQAVENLNSGNSESNLDQFADELAQAKSLGIEAIEEAPIEGIPVEKIDSE